MRALAIAAALLLSGCSLQMNVPQGFLRLSEQESGDLRAVTPAGARIWVRDFAVDNGAELGFWVDAVAVDLQQARGYELGDAAEIRDGEGRAGKAFTGSTRVAGERCGYFVAVFLLPRSWLPMTHDHVRVVEFAAPAEQFDANVEAVRAAVASLK